MEPFGRSALLRDLLGALQVCPHRRLACAIWGCHPRPLGDREDRTVSALELHLFDDTLRGFRLARSALDLAPVPTRPDRLDRHQFPSTGPDSAAGEFPAPANG